MMRILLDIGNTSINWAVEENGDFIIRNRFNYESISLARQLEQEIQFTDMHQTTSVLVSNVAGNELIKTVQVWVDNHWQIELWQAKVGVSFGKLVNSYKDISQMGVDRWLAMVAAWHEHEKALCVVDCGTAITIDSIDDSGQHLGGYIIPGIEMQQQTLIENTSGINVSVDNNISTTHADNTQDAIKHGAALAVVAAIEHVVTVLKNEFHLQPKCIITGGMAVSVQTLLRQAFNYETDLVL